MCQREMKFLSSSFLQLYDAFPSVMKHLPGRHNKIFSNFNGILDFIGEEVQSHKKDVDHSNPRDYIDAFIIEMEKVCEQPCNVHTVWSAVKLPFITVSSQQNKGTHLGFTEANLALCSLDLFLAGTETTSTTLLWAMVFLIKHPDIQGRWHATHYATHYANCETTRKRDLSGYS